MAGNNASTPAPRSKRAAPTSVSKPKRAGFALDMTPLVDIAFLLLTFFMFSTTMNTPQTMEMKMPADTTGVEMACSEIMTILVRGDNKVFYRICDDAPQEILAGRLRDLAMNRNLALKNRLVTSLKIAQESSYATVIAVLDELNLAELDITAQLSDLGVQRKRRFTITRMTAEDRAAIAGLR